VNLYRESVRLVIVLLQLWNGNFCEVVRGEERRIISVEYFRANEFPNLVKGTHLYSTPFDE
jgi:hypothetical protein